MEQRHCTCTHMHITLPHTQAHKHTQGQYTNVYGKKEWQHAGSYQQQLNVWLHGLAISQIKLSESKLFISSQFI